MTVIYVDTLFLLNGLVDYFLLLAAAKVAGEPCRRLQLALGAVIGGGYAVAIYLPGLSFLASPLCRFAVALLMVLTAFWNSKRLFRQLLIFFALACAFSGGILSIEWLGGHPFTLGKGVLYSDMDLKMVLLAGAGCYLVLTLLFRQWGRHGGNRGALVPVVLQIQGKRASFTGLIDTGNTLMDPISGQPVIVAEAAGLEELLPDVLQKVGAMTENPSSVLEELEDGEWRRRVRLLPYRTVGVSCGLLLAIRVDQAWVDGVLYRNQLVALSPTPVSDGGPYRGLIGVM